MENTLRSLDFSCPLIFRTHGSRRKVTVGSNDVLEAVGWHLQLRDSRRMRLRLTRNPCLGIRELAAVIGVSLYHLTQEY